MTGRAAGMDLAGMVTLAGRHAAGHPQARYAAAMGSGSREARSARAQATPRPARHAGRHAGRPARASAGHAARLARASARHRLTPQQTARSLLSRFGWSAGQFQYLSLLWARESGWNPYAANPASGAYGIPQAVPGSKMASAGADWRWNARTQIRWGLSYIAARYGSPAGAWQHESADGWY